MRTLTICAVALTLLSSVAFGQRYDGDNYRQDQYYDRDRQADQYSNQSRQYDDRDLRGRHKWRPGEVLPGEFLNRVVTDWEERGLSRPPGDHHWVRVGQQFVLVRERDRMIARILNFD